MDYQRIINIRRYGFEVSMGQDIPAIQARDVHAVRWYVLTLPACHRGPSRGLREEQARRADSGEPSFEFFAPTFVAVCRREGRWVRSERPLLYNYVFIRSSVYEIFRMKRELPLYNFLRSAGRRGDYPYLTEGEMDNLRWVARSYSDELPLYQPEPGCLSEGDRIRITEGRFRGVEASVVIRPGVGDRDVMVSVDNWLWVPLLRVRPGEYEVVALSDRGKRVYDRLDNPRIWQGLHEALGRHWAGCLTDADRSLASEVVRAYGQLRMDSTVMRCKLYSLLLPAYTIRGDDERRKSLEAAMVSFLPLIRAEQSLALLLVTLYGCTDSSVYYYRSHELVDPWGREPSPRRGKLTLIRRLADYDRWLKHLEN